MISRVLFAAVITVFAFAHVLALQQIHAVEPIVHSTSSATVIDGD